MQALGLEENRMVPDRRTSMADRKPRIAQGRTPRSTDAGSVQRAIQTTMRRRPGGFLDRAAGRRIEHDAAFRNGQDAVGEGLNEDRVSGADEHGQPLAARQGP